MFYISVKKNCSSFKYSASRWFNYTPFPSSDTETQSNTRICHITCANISFYTIYSSRIRVYSAYLFVKLAIRVILCVFLFAQYVKTTLFRSSEGLFKWGGVRNVQNFKDRLNCQLVTRIPNWRRRRSVRESFDFKQGTFPLAFLSVRTSRISHSRGTFIFMIFVCIIWCEIKAVNELITRV